MPIFEPDEDRTYFLTAFLIHPDFMISNENGNEYRNDITTKKLTDNEQLVLNTIRMDATVTIVKMVDLLGLSKATIARATKSLREKKVIDREGASKNGKWIILK